MHKLYPTLAASHTASHLPSRLHRMPCASCVASSTLLITAYVLGASSIKTSTPLLRHRSASTLPLPPALCSAAQGLYSQPLFSLPLNFGSRTSAVRPVFKHHIIMRLAKSLHTITSFSSRPNSTCTFLPMPPEPLLITAFHFSSRRS